MMWLALSISPYLQVSVKASAVFRVIPAGGASEWPYASTGPQLRQLLDTFGTRRVLWAGASTRALISSS
jgi:hypothetical protein